MRGMPSGGREGRTHTQANQRVYQVRRHPQLARRGRRRPSPDEGRSDARVTRGALESEGALPCPIIPSPTAARAASAGRRRPPPSRSRAPAPRAAAAARSGTTSSTPPGAVRDGSTAEPGPDSYHRYREDVELLKRLGVDRYRFSISWVRVQPTGAGAANAEGIAYYDRVVDELLDAGVTPFPTLYHWDLPVEPRGARRLARPRDRLPVRRLRRARRGRARRPGEGLVHDQRAGLDVAAGLRDRRARARPAAAVRVAARPCTISCWPTASPRASCASAARRRSASSTTTPTCVPRRTRPRIRRPRTPTTCSTTGSSPSPCCSGAIPTSRRSGMPPMPVEPGDLEIISTPTDVYGFNFYNPTTIAAAPRREPRPVRDRADPGCRAHRVRSGVADRARGADRCARGLPRALRRRAAADRHRARTARRSPSPTPSPARSTTSSASSISRGHIAAVGARASRACASTSTRCGRCSTTSSGPRDSPSDSDSCTSTMRRASGRRRRRSTGTATLIEEARS